MEVITVLTTPQKYSKSGKLEEYIGIVHSFPDPYHLYLNNYDLKAKSNIIKFIIYSAGKKKIVMIGYYNKLKDDFKVKYSCKYNTKDLINYYNKWITKYINAINIVKNRITKRQFSFAGISPDPLISNYDNYKQLKIWLSMKYESEYYIEPENKNDFNYRISLITPEYKKLISKLPESENIKILEDELLINTLSGNINPVSKKNIKEEINELNYSLISRLDKLVEEYEKNINISEIQSRDKEIVKISKKFYKWIERSTYNSDIWYNTLEKCNCVNYDDPGCQIINWGFEEELI